ncbi:hypothetical protein L249_1691 [Ophiocordyceps polyrhachis-furcata BCC 54312]|uniref:GRIP domain-containing protein n=1 Tax=Ophiocordyceps polyrhachis-furcata BCC 54312 TaxID=1330021 RepID=A0A367LSJ6_9HYPO|nr:hypothetical protein L249_1691 [Ophiocordyceps polyrhachis-furcata BCC 54312]
MFQRIKGAIDRTIAEEQARQKSIAESSTTSRPPSNSSRRNESPAAAKRPRAKRPSSVDTSDAAPNPDPAVFEAAFVIDDSDEPSRAASPRPPQPSKDDSLQDPLAESEKPAIDDHAQGQDEKGSRDDGGPNRQAADPPSHPPAATGLTPEIRQRLRKLEKLEATYPELLRSYRVAHKRATAIEPFEKALRENSPLVSISDPDALVEYLNQLNLRGDMVMQELKRVSADRDDLKKKQQEAQVKSSREAKGVDGVEDEGPKLRADLAAKDVELERLGARISDLETELTSAKEARVELEAKVEDAARQVHGQSDTTAARDSAQSQSEESAKSIASLTEQLDKSKSQLMEVEDRAKKEIESNTSKAREMEASLAASDKRAAELDADLAKANAAKSISKKLIGDLQSQIAELQKDKAEAVGKMDELTKKLQSQPPSTAASAQQAAAGSGASKKKGKKKKGKGGPVAGPAAAVADEAADEAADSSVDVLEAEITKLKNKIQEKDAHIERLSAKRKTEEDLREEIETLQEDLVNIGQDHVDAKEKIKMLEGERASLTKQVTELETKTDASTSADAAVQKDLDALRKEFEDLRGKSSTLKSDLGAAQKLAQTRFKDLTDLREVLQKVQPELKALRQESADLKTAREELTAKAKELKDAERKERELKRETSRLQQLSMDRETEMKNLQERLKAENSSRQQADEGKRLAEREMRRVEADKIELSAKAEQLERELQKTQAEVMKLRPRIKELEEQVHKTKRDWMAAQEEADFKTQQYSNAQALLSSMRDQTAEMSTQLKEARSQAESLEEELGEVRRLLQERTREGETMRCLLADVDERADGRVREMQGRMEAAIEERERIEDESSLVARRNARETEGLKNKVRDLEREVQTLSQARDELAERERDWNRRREKLEAIEAKAEAEAEESRSTATQLRSALDASEKQLRDKEQQRAELRRMLDEAGQRYERSVRELKSAQARLSPSRTSMESSRSGVVAGGGAAADTVYLKTILLQFLEQKDGKLRAQLVPVLGKLLKFDKADEVKWISAVQHIEVR